MLCSGFLGFIASIAHIHIYIDSIVHTCNIASNEEDRAFLFIYYQGGVGQLAKIYIGESAIVAVRLPGPALDTCTYYYVRGLVDQVIIESCPNAGRSHNSSFHLPA